MISPSLLLPLLGVAGLCVGSFLNVCIWRLPRGESIAFPPSHCPRCREPIRWIHNVPIVGYLVLRGRCARCGDRISPMYPIVEGVTAILFVLHGLVIGWDVLLVPRLAFAAAMLVLFVIDLQHQILPNVITLPGIAAGLVLSVFLPPGWVASAAGVALGGGVLWLVAEVYWRVRHVEGLGMGDVKMLAMVGAFLGWPLALLTLVLSSLLGAVLGVAIIASGRGTLQLKLPFGTFLAVAAIAASLWGQPIVQWYAGFYR